jgi:hypothetical protein
MQPLFSQSTWTPRGNRPFSPNEPDIKSKEPGRGVAQERKQFHAFADGNLHVFLFESLKSKSATGIETASPPWRAK